jgi:hypothetical protein
MQRGGNHARSPAKLVLYIVTATCALLIATVWVSYDTARVRLEEQTRSEAKKQVQATASTLDSYVDRVAGTHSRHRRPAGIDRPRTRRATPFPISRTSSTPSVPKKPTVYSSPSAMPGGRSARDAMGGPASQPNRRRRRDDFAQSRARVVSGAAARAASSMSPSPCSTEAVPRPCSSA